MVVHCELVGEALSLDRRKEWWDRRSVRFGWVRWIKQESEYNSNHSGSSHPNETDPARDRHRIHDLLRLAPLTADYTLIVMQRRDINMLPSMGNKETIPPSPYRCRAGACGSVLASTAEEPHSHISTTTYILR